MLQTPDKNDLIHDEFQSPIRPESLIVKRIGPGEERWVFQDGTCLSIQLESHEAFSKTFLIVARDECAVVSLRELRRATSQERTVSNLFWNSLFDGFNEQRYLAEILEASLVALNGYCNEQNILLCAAITVKSGADELFFFGSGIEGFSVSNDASKQEVEVPFTNVYPLGSREALLMGVLDSSIRFTNSFEVLPKYKGSYLSTIKLSSIP